MESNFSSVAGVIPVGQYIAWLLGVLLLILGLYVWVLNAWQRPNVRRAANYIVTALFVLAVEMLAVGGLAGASNTSQASLPTIILAIASPMVPVALLMTAVSLLRSDLLWRVEAVQQNKQNLSVKIFKLGFYWGTRILIALPLLFTLLDLLFARFSLQINNQPFRFWYQGLDAASYAGGYTLQDNYIGGLLEPVLVVINFIIVNLITLTFLIYELSREKLLPIIHKTSFSELSFASPTQRRLTWILLIAFLPGLALSSVNDNQISLIYLLASHALLAVTYPYAIYQRNMGTTAITESAEDRMTSGETAQAAGASLQTRLVIATIVVVIPLLAAMGILLIRQAQLQLEISAAESLSQLNASLADSVNLWLDGNLKALENVAASPIIRSMDPVQQQAMLESTVSVYDKLYLVSTLDLNGENLARSDGQPNRDYSAQSWFQKVSQSGKAVYQPMIGRDIWKPDILIAIPVRNETGAISGYLMALSSLDEVSNRFQETRLGEQGFAILVDEQSRLLAHPDWAQEFIQTQYGLQDLTSYPPVAALSSTLQIPSGTSGQSANFRFTGSEGSNWQAALSKLDNGWGLVVQQREDELLAPIADFRSIALIVLIAGAGMLIPLMLLTVRNSLLPVRKLTETASAIASGDLEQLAPSEIAAEPGEIGLLAQTFNSMTAQLRQLIGGLEQRVAERTRVVEQRAIQLQVTAEVARETASIRDPEELLRNVVNLISERFGFYHAGIFLLQSGGVSNEEGFVGTGEAEGYAVLQAASSEGGQRMLARHHRLKAGPAGSGVGIVGYVAYTGQPRIALDVGADAAFFNNPDLPLTRSEMALPLMIASKGAQRRSEAAREQRRVIGVLDVQSTQEAAFKQEDIEILQILADQVAVALENARLLSESQNALRQLEQIYGERIRQSWQERLRSDQMRHGARKQAEVVYTFNSSHLNPVTVQTSSADQNNPKSDEALPAIDHGSEEHRVEAPILLRGQKLGQMVLQRQRTWSQQEKELINETMDQVALAIENARLLEEIQQRAFQEELVSQIITQTQRSLDLETVMRVFVQQVSQTIRAEKIQLQLMAETLQQTIQADDTSPISEPDQEDKGSV